MESNEKTACDTNSMDVGSEDDTVTEIVSNSTEISSDERVKPLYLFVCEICQEEFTSQLKFFGHLKAHYEDLQQSQQKVEIGENPVHLEAEESENNLNPSRGLEETEANSLDEDGDASRVENLTVASLESGEENGKLVAAAKVLQSCPKCKRTFRREKTYQTHVESCQKLQESDDGVDPIDSEPKSRNKALKRSKVKYEVKSEVVVEEIVEDMMEEGLTLEETIPAMHDPLEEEQIFEGEDILEDEFFGDEDSHQCTVCQEVLPSRNKLEIHLKKAHSEEPPVNNAKGKKKRASGQRRQDVLKCPQCQRIFNHRNSLVYHMRSHTGERPHQCEMCGKSFFATSALKVHMRLHSGEKPYKCENCGRHFRQWGDLKYHMISIHSDIRQYQCEFCGKDFARKYSLIVHRRIHTGERNYKCEFCNKCFRAASYLQNHRRIHTGEKPHACTICGKPFRVRSDMKRHMASHNRESHQGHAANNIVHQSTQNVQNVVTVSSLANPSQQQIITIGPQITQQIAQVVRSGGSIQVPVTSDGELHQAQQISLEDGNEVVITGDIVDGTPINITLTQDGLTAHSSLEAAAVATLQPAEIQEGVIYPNREGTLETVTIRESNTGTLYVWPVFMN